tara:strand:- start:65 stop:1141 length:1077 start_codon:yes stop_codon:yes gene_type:complete
MKEYILPLVITIIFLTVILIINVNKTETDEKNKFNKLLNLIRLKTRLEISKVEEEASSDKPLKFNPNGIPDLRDSDDINKDNYLDGKNIYESFENYNQYSKIIPKNKQIKIILFYTLTCPHSQSLMPIWYKIKEDLNDYNKNRSSIDELFIEEINCSTFDNKEKCRKYRINTVPTIILESDKVYIYRGNNTYDDIKNFLKSHGISISNISTDNFAPVTDLEHSLNISDPDYVCPEITFDSKYNFNNKTYSYQIFNSQGQYGYSEGGDNQVLTPFQAAYNTVDTYLSSLPNDNTINMCASKNSKGIRGFGLCNKEKLDKINDYQNNINNGKSKKRLDSDIDYTSNDRTISAIKKSCGFT